MQQVWWFGCRSNLNYINHRGWNNGIGVQMSNDMFTCIFYARQFKTVGGWSLVLTNICCNFRVMMLNLSQVLGFSSSVQPSQSLEFWFPVPKVCWVCHSSLTSRSRHPPSSLFGGRTPTGSARCTSTSQLLDISGTHCTQSTLKYWTFFHLVPCSDLLFKTLHTSHSKLSIARCPT